MSIDISQFHQTYLAEAFEHLESLETGLLALEQGAGADINAIFRAAHSIKGGAATFGFADIAAFTHTMESVLDKCRDNTLVPTSALINALLAALDILKELLVAARNNTPADQAAPTRGEVTKRLEQFLKGGTTAATAQASAALEEGERLLIITFKPQPNFALTGSDPVNIFRELASFGELSVVAHTENLPTLTDLNPEHVCLWWQLELITTASEKTVREVFMFVEDDAEIIFKTQALIDKKPPAAQTTVHELVQVVEQGERRQTPDRRATDRRGDAAPAANRDNYIRVSIDKIDGLMNLIGELVTSHAMVVQHTTGADTDSNSPLMSAVTDMSRHTRTLQEAIMSVRMMPVDFAFSRFPRMVRDTAQKLGKQVNLVTTGGNTELDKTVIEQISDPLTHLVRNSVDHGIELPEERAAAGKPPEGTITLAAFYRGGNVVIEVKDDGRGLPRDKILKKAIERGLTTPENAEKLTDAEVQAFIFESGFSTASVVTDVSGRGVGMDVVRKNIQSLGGSVAINSKAGVGTIFTITLPLTLAILDGMATKVGGEIYMVPLLAILESIRPAPSRIKTVQNGVEVIDFRGEYLPLLRLSDVLKVPSADHAVRELTQGIAVIVEAESTRMALFVDDLLGERQVVIKSIEANYKQVEGISGATILGDGRVALIADLPALARLAAREGRFATRPKLSADEMKTRMVEYLSSMKSARHFSPQSTGAKP